ncbi:MAG: copper-translocating P-type ATPase [Oscillatoriales cyanobacterium]|nr:MAG: copper-translocating P-type ATPase [Oscillatoriales cyanobacterium]
MTSTMPTVAPRPTVVLSVSGMKCGGCVAAVETRLKRQPAVADANVNLVTGLAVVDLWPGTDVQATLPTLTATLTGAGFPSEVQPADLTPIAPDSATEDGAWWQPLIVAGLLLLVSTLGHLDRLGGPPIPIVSRVEFHFLVATLALLFPGRDILLEGFRSLLRGIPTMNSLIGLGTGAAYLASIVALVRPSWDWACFFDEPAMLLGFVLLGRTIEARVRVRSRESFKALLALKPAMARRLGAEPTALDPAMTTESVSVGMVRVGQILLVLPGDRVPVDGDVRLGTTAVDEAMLTGESQPVAKGPGDRLLAGTLNQSGAIVMRAQRVGRDTELARIVQLVAEAQGRKAPIQRLADRVAGYFCWGVMALAALTLVFWAGLGDRFPQVLQAAATSSSAHIGHGHAAHSSALVLPLAPLELALKLAISVLVVACPCALGLATPTAILVGASWGAERGLLIRGGDVLERLQQVQTVVFDKTGTLTTGQPVVVDRLALVPEVTVDQLLQWAAAVERGTHHPLARAIGQAATHLPALSATAFATEPGLGARADVDGQPVWVGNAAWIARSPHPLSESAQTLADQWAQAGKTPIFVTRGDRLVGMLSTADELRPDAIATVSTLQQMGLELRILTGDRPEVATALADRLGIPRSAVYAEMRPDQKAQAIAQWPHPAMVGDGINDAPAIATATVGIALGSATDAALETAGVVLTRDRLLDVATAIHLGRATFRKIRQNLLWAIAYNAIGIPLAAGVGLPTLGIGIGPATAAALMAFSSVSVVCNSLLLRRSARSSLGSRPEPD